MISRFEQTCAEGSVNFNCSSNDLSRKDIGRSEHDEVSFQTSEVIPFSFLQFLCARCKTYVGNSPQRHREHREKHREERHLTLRAILPRKYFRGLGCREDRMLSSAGPSRATAL